MAKAQRKSLQDTVSAPPPKPLPKPDLDLAGLENVTKKLERAGEPTAPPVREKTSRKAVAKPPKEPEKPKRLSVDLDPELFFKYKEWCAAKRITMKKRTIQMIVEAVGST